MVAIMEVLEVQYPVGRALIIIATIGRIKIAIRVRMQTAMAVQVAGME